MTAEELYEIVKDWPENAYPFDTQYGTRQGRPSSTGVWYVDGTEIGSEHVAMLFESSGLRWLLNNGVQPLCFERNNSDRTPERHPQYLPGHYLCEDMSVGGCYRHSFGPTILHAISATIAAKLRENNQ